MTQLTVLLLSAGRRPYLVRWFQEAFVRNHVDGRVVVADHSPQAPSRGIADTFVSAPAVNDPAYADWLTDIVSILNVDLALSVNDFELSEWAALPTQHPELSVLIRLDQATQLILEDKLIMAEHFARAGIAVPHTTLASQIDAFDLGSEAVVKGRFGSGSKGLAFTDRNNLDAAVNHAAAQVTDQRGRRPSNIEQAQEWTIVQPRMAGYEVGLDVVNDLDGNFATVLARRKLTMRGGETDRAQSIDPAPFRELAKTLSTLLSHRGPIDVDVIVGPDNSLTVIDLNPRFGGGYPFSHLASAHIPAAMVAWLIGAPPNPEWLTCQPGVASAKYIELAHIDPGP